MQWRAPRWLAVLALLGASAGWAGREEMPPASRYFWDAFIGEPPKYTNLAEFFLSSNKTAQSRALRNPQEEQAFRDFLADSDVQRMVQEGRSLRLKDIRLRLGVLPELRSDIDLRAAERTLNSFQQFIRNRDASERLPSAAEARQMAESEVPKVIKLEYGTGAMPSTEQVLRERSLNAWREDRVARRAYARANYETYAPHAGPSASDYEKWRRRELAAIVQRISDLRANLWRPLMEALLDQVRFRPVDLSANPQNGSKQDRRLSAGSLHDLKIVPAPDKLWSRVYVNDMAAGTYDFKVVELPSGEKFIPIVIDPKHGYFSRTFAFKDVEANPTPLTLHNNDAIVEFKEALVQLNALDQLQKILAQSRAPKSYEGLGAQLRTTYEGALQRRWDGGSYSLDRLPRSAFPELEFFAYWAKIQDQGSTSRWIRRDELARKRGGRGFEMGNFYPEDDLGLGEKLRGGLHGLLDLAKAAFAKGEDQTLTWSERVWNHSRATESNDALYRVAGPWMGAPRSFILRSDEELKDAPRWSPKAGVRASFQVESQRPFSSTDRTLALPISEAHELSAVEFHNADGALVLGSDFYVVYDAERHGARAIFSHDQSGLKVRLAFSPRPAPVAVPTPELQNLDRPTLRALAAELGQAKLTELSRALGTELDRVERKGASFSIRDLGDLFSRKSFYSYNTDLNHTRVDPAPAEGRFAFFAQYSDAQGKLCFQCNGAAALFKDFMNAYFADHLGPGSGLHAETRTSITRLGAKLRLPLHATVEILRDGKIAAALDTTPQRPDLWSRFLTPERESELDSLPAPEVDFAGIAQKFNQHALKLGADRAAAIGAFSAPWMRTKKYAIDKDEPVARALRLARHLEAYLQNPADVGARDYFRSLAPDTSPQPDSAAVAALARTESASIRVQLARFVDLAHKGRPGTENPFTRYLRVKSLGNERDPLEQLLQSLALGPDLLSQPEWRALSELEHGFARDCSAPYRELAQKR